VKGRGRYGGDSAGKKMIELAKLRSNIPLSLIPKLPPYEENCIAGFIHLFYDFLCCIFSLGSVDLLERAVFLHGYDML